ncbi:MAG TPA: 4Fe-4S dicluster domain-containing protein [Acidimicrobiales bacterium]|nr:4Fe-4S dicluster domain-containing protein [Acidimicrobiales bacterium]
MPVKLVAGAAVVVGARCTACGACLATCPEGALLPAPRRPLVDGAACTGCLECLEVCPAGAIDRAGAA